MALNLGLWVWAATVTKLLESHGELLERHGPRIDWTSGSIFGKVFALAVMFEFTAFATQTLLYWLISCSKFDNDPVHQWIFYTFHNQCQRTSLLSLTWLEHFVVWNVLGKLLHLPSSLPTRQTGYPLDWISVSVSNLLASGIIVDEDTAPSVIFSLPFAWLVIRKIGVDEFEELNFDDTDEKRNGDIEVKVKEDHEDAGMTCHWCIYHGHWKEPTEEVEKARCQMYTYAPFSFWFSLRVIILLPNN